MSISDLILDVCSSDRVISGYTGNSRPRRAGATAGSFSQQQFPSAHIFPSREEALVHGQTILPPMVHICDPGLNAIHHPAPDLPRSEEHTSELQSLMRISYAVFCLKKKNKNTIKIKRSA